MEKIYTSVDEACAALSIGRTNMYKLIASGAVESFKLGRRRLITVASLKSLAAASCP